MLFEEVEPLPDPYWIGAQICQLMVNLWSKGKRYKLEDFLPVTNERHRRQPQTPEEMYMAFRAATEPRR
jgi:hypothetical protein